MKFNIISKDIKIKNIKVAFDLANVDTCMKEWILEVVEDERGKRIMHSNIKFSGQGCKGHPKTISALIKNLNLKDINVNELKETTCFRNNSCGMILGSCIEEFIGNAKLQF